MNKAMDSIGDVFETHKHCATNPAEAEAVFAAILTALREKVVGSVLDQHAIVWARRTPTDVVAHPGCEVSPAVMALAESDVIKAAKSLVNGMSSDMIPDHVKKMIDEMSELVMPGLSLSERRYRMLLDVVASFVVHSSVREVAGSAHAAAVMLIGVREAMHISGVPQTFITVHFDHIALGSRVLFLPCVLDADFKVTRVDAPDPLVLNVNPALNAFKDMLPPSCYGQSRGVS